MPCPSVSLVAVSSDENPDRDPVVGPTRSGIRRIFLATTTAGDRICGFSRARCTFLSLEISEICPRLLHQQLILFPRVRIGEGPANSHELHTLFAELWSLPGAGGVQP